MNPFDESLISAVRVFESLSALWEPLEQAADWCAENIAAGGKLLTCGNGGSACEAQHLAGELVGRYLHDRPSLPAIALNADGALLSCIGNDYCFDDVFARQVEGLGRPGDVLVAFSTSGNSPNVVNALRTAKRLGVRSIAFLGRDGGPAREHAEHAIVVPHSSTARVQEAHQFLLHCLMDRLEARLGAIAQG